MIGVARKPANFEAAARRRAKTPSEASRPLEASVFSIVAGLEGHDLDGLRRYGAPIWAVSRLLISSVGC